MNTTLGIKDTTSSSFTLQLIREQLDVIIERQHAEIQLLRKQLSEKNHVAAELRQALQDCRQNAEGHHQLVNKLLNDISGYQNDIDWYRRTYEKRSFLGTIRQKLFRR